MIIKQINCNKLEYKKHVFERGFILINSTELRSGTIVQGTFCDGCFEMRKLKIYDSLENETREVAVIENGEKVIIKGKKAYIVLKDFKFLNQLESDVIVVPYHLEDKWECFIIE